MEKKRVGTGSFQLDPPKILILGFAIIIMIGSILLHLPAATEDGQGFPWLDAIFTATSATCVTGLVVQALIR